MLDDLPLFVSLLFFLTVMLTLFLLLRMMSSRFGKINYNWYSFVIIILWLTLQLGLTLAGVYSIGNDSLPPKILVYGIAPTLVTIMLFFLLRKGRNFISGLSILDLTIIHVVRIPVELVLYLLFVYNAVPKLMTFEGRNLDVLMGIISILVVYLLAKGKINKSWLIAWNIIGLFFLFNIVGSALLSAPSPLQKLAFDQPNIAIFYFPFSWLPTFVVPVVLFSHLAALQKLLINKS